MPTIYKGVKVPVGTDYSSGPTMATDMVDSFPSADFYKTLDSGETAGPFRHFTDVAAMNAWAAPLGSLAFVLANGGLYARVNNTATPPVAVWDQITTAASTPPYVPLGHVFTSDGSGVVQTGSGIAPNVRGLVVSGNIGTIRLHRTVMIRVSCRGFLNSPAAPTTLQFQTDLNMGGPVTTINAGFLSIQSSDTAKNLMPVFTTTTMHVNNSSTHAASVQLYAKNVGTATAGVRDTVIQVAEI
jgi:hypothetical protein